MRIAWLASLVIVSGLSACGGVELGSRPDAGADSGAADSEAGSVEASAADGGTTTSNVPPGAAAGSVVGVPGSCSGAVYRVVPASDCGFLDCAGTVAYAICDGSSYGLCDCAIPAGYVLAQ